MSTEVQDYYRRILPFYDAELSERGDEDFWARMAGEPPGCRVLELGAGTGRATAFLAQKAGRVVASELSPELIAEARRKLHGLANVHLLAADMRELSLQEEFDLIAAVDDPFVHLTEDEDRDQAFAVVAEHLAPGGRFVLDAAWFPPEDREDAADGLVREHAAQGGKLCVRQIWHCDPETRLCTARFEYRRDGELETQASFPGRLWSVEELEDRARSAGLRISCLWGDYDLRAWDRGSSQRLVAEMTKA
ncbi:MAG TPA: class I SAM-dependent methyltransferase [Thermoanaerobaculia bacterium]|jgi:SAM-dependent methyltransferase|nr:class I SAM-dependent methyltransferase [Thermoanaerobaculia bacterium]